MSLTLKRTCPFTLTSHSYNENHTLPAMDPDPFSSRYLDKTTYNEWQSLSPTTIPEEVFPDTSSQRSPSPPKRPRNAKNLSLSVPAIPKNTPGSTSAPASPFRSPRLPSRRPSNLTINIHSLHRHPSTPELYASNIGTPIVASPAPYTSNQFPGFNIDSQLAESERPKARHTDPTANKVPYEESVEREKAYPDGPRLILEPNIWLYAEPDLELAKTYDVVVNVAREVGNPFIVTETLVPRRLSPGSDFEEATPSPYSPSSSSVSNPSPSLPSSTSSTLSPQHPIKHMEAVMPTSYRYNNVEYMHIPWDHHSTLSGELPGIVNDILKRSEEGKKVLVHCQCGVSRSATLVIALVMKKLGMGINEAYAYVQQRSPWIGPNMSLIYQLAEYGRLGGYDRKPAGTKTGQASAPSTAPLESSESRRYKGDEEVSPKTMHSHLSRPSMARTQSQDRHKFLDVDVDRVAEKLSSPQFVVSNEANQNDIIGGHEQ